VAAGGWPTTRRPPGRWSASSPWAAPEGLLSAGEIAAELYVSVNTIKSHIKSIYRKLDANRRWDAVRRARQLNLL
jgi:hypothetical protein